MAYFACDPVSTIQRLAWPMCPSWRHTVSIALDQIKNN